MALECTLLNLFTICLSQGVESDYTGPTLENGKVTLGFMKDLMAAYKEQKRLHKKYAYQVYCNNVQKLKMEFLVSRMLAKLPLQKIVMLILE